MKNMRYINIFGSKVQTAKSYPNPIYDIIVENFAGGAGYSLLHWQKQVYLYDKNEDIVNAWDYIIKASPEEVLELPLIEKDQLVSELNCSEGGRLAISWCLNQLAKPAKKLSSWGVYHNERGAACYWGEARRKQMAVIASRVKHWKVELKDYREVENRKATWFLDPPFEDGKEAYKYKDIDFQELANYAKSRQGQLIVCERDTATWLPFEPLCESPTQRRYGDAKRKKHISAMYYQET